MSDVVMNLRVSHKTLLINDKDRELSERSTVVGIKLRESCCIYMYHTI